MTNRLFQTRLPPRPDAIRTTAGGFAFIPIRFLRDGHFAALGPDELKLYVFLVLVANRDGVSWYDYEKIGRATGLDLDRYLSSRDRLIHRKLIALAASVFQVLELPTEPIQTATASKRPASSASNPPKADVNARQAREILAALQKR